MSVFSRCYCAAAGTVRHSIIFIVAFLTQQQKQQPETRFRSRKTTQQQSQYSCVPCWLCIKNFETSLTISMDISRDTKLCDNPPQASKASGERAANCGINSPTVENSPTVPYYIIILLYCTIRILSWYLSMRYRYRTIYRCHSS